MKNATWKAAAEAQERDRMLSSCWQCVRCMEEHPGLVMDANDVKCFIKTCQLPRSLVGLDINSKRKRNITNLLTYTDVQGQAAAYKDVEQCNVVKSKPQQELSSQDKMPQQELSSQDKMLQHDDKSSSKEEKLQPDLAAAEAAAAPLPSYDSHAVPMRKPAVTTCKYGVGKQPRPMHWHLAQQHKACKMYASSHSADSPPDSGEPQRPTSAQMASRTASSRQMTPSDPSRRRGVKRRLLERAGCVRVNNSAIAAALAAETRETRRGQVASRKSRRLTAAGVRISSRGPSGGSGSSGAQSVVASRHAGDAPETGGGGKGAPLGLGGTGAVREAEKAWRFPGWAHEVLGNDFKASRTVKFQVGKTVPTSVHAARELLRF